jgi:hypothetical protein
MGSDFSISPLFSIPADTRISTRQLTDLHGAECVKMTHFFINLSPRKGLAGAIPHITARPETTHASISRILLQAEA